MADTDTEPLTLEELRVDFDPYVRSVELNSNKITVVTDDGETTTTPIPSQIGDRSVMCVFVHLGDIYAAGRYAMLDDEAQNERGVWEVELEEDGSAVSDVEVFSSAAKIVDFASAVVWRDHYSIAEADASTACD